MAHWWNEIQWRMIQTNLREIDMENINAAEYVRQLKEFNANVVTLNAAGIIASYETELECQTKSSYLHGDSLKHLVESCHKEGIHVICRTDFSKVRYALYEKHPEWAYHTASGEIMNYNGDVQTCPNGEYQKKYMFDILNEVLTKIPFDGVFLNMSGFMVVDYSGKYYGPCHCENCQREFKKAFGMELPEKDDPRDPAYLRYMGFKTKVMKEQKESLYAFIKKINPEIAVNGFDYLRTESNTEIDREQWQYSASMNSRLSSGHERKIPSDNASVDFMGFRYRDISVSPAQLELRQWQNLANSNCLSFYLMGTPENHKDISGFEPTKKVFRFAKEQEDIYTGLQSDAEVLVLHSGMPQRNDHEAEGLIRVLSESHIPFDEASIKSMDTLQSLAHWKLVVLPNVPMINDAQIQALDAYVKDGGMVMATGDTACYTSTFQPSSRTLLNCLGIQKTIEKKKDAMSTMFRLKENEKEIFPHCVEENYIAAGAEVTTYEYVSGVAQYMELVPEHPFGPPERCYFTEVQDHPSVSVNTYGKGKGISVPWLPGTFYRTEGYANTFNFLKDVFLYAAEVKSVSETLTPMVEVVITKKEKMHVIQLINNTGMFLNSYVAPVPVRQIELTIPGCRGNVITLCGGHVEPKIIDHECVIRLDELKEYEAIVIKEEN